MVAEARHARHQAAWNAPSRPWMDADPDAREGAEAAAAPQPPPVKVYRDGAALLDCDTIAFLLRLLSLPASFNTSHLFKVLFHLCANTKARGFILSSLMSIAGHACTFSIT